MAKPDYDNPEDREFITELLEYKERFGLTYAELTDEIRADGYPLRHGDLGRAASMTGRATNLCQRPGFREGAARTIARLLLSTAL